MTEDYCTKRHQRVYRIRSVTISIGNLGQRPVHPSKITKTSNTCHSCDSIPFFMCIATNTTHIAKCTVEKTPDAPRSTLSKLSAPTINDPPNQAMETLTKLKFSLDWATCDRQHANVMGPVESCAGSVVIAHWHLTWESPAMDTGCNRCEGYLRSSRWNSSL